MKDPAFLFYSKDFYEGTRMMLPEERACYIDLLIYQHQNGPIPLDLKRVVMYCNGVDLATLEATLKAKFERTDNGWVNSRLNEEISARENFKSSQSTSGRIGQFWKKAKQILSKSDFSKLREMSLNKEEIICFLEENETNKDTLEGLLKHRLNNNANANAIVNENKDEIKIEKNVEKKFFDEFNEKCTRLSKVQILNQQRKTKISARIRDFGLEKTFSIIDLVSVSNFLNGENDRNWKASFDWILEPKNFTKILEGNYNNKPNGKPTYQNSGFSGNTAGQNGKISARTILAQRLAGKAAGNNESGNITIDVEACE